MAAVRASAGLERTNFSTAFEAFWRSLPKEGLVPRKADFRPERMPPQLLPKIMLADVDLGEPPRLPIRLIGTAVRDRIQADITGLDYLTLVPEPDRTLTLLATRAIVEQPCGLWLVMVADYPHGYPLFTELTIFPMKSGIGEGSLLIALANELPGAPLGLDATGLTIRPEHDRLHSYLDIGAGLPVFD